MSTNITTIDTDNYAVMAKAMGMATDTGTKQKASTLARLRINHSPLMGQSEINGKNVNVEVVDYHGGSLRGYGSKSIDAKQCPNLNSMIEAEKHIFKKSTYTKLMKEMSSKRFNFMNKIYDIKAMREEFKELVNRIKKEKNNKNR